MLKLFQNVIEKEQEFIEAKRAFRKSISTAPLCQVLTRIECAKCTDLLPELWDVVCDFIDHEPTITLIHWLPMDCWCLPTRLCMGPNKITGYLDRYRGCTVFRGPETFSINFESGQVAGTVILDWNESIALMWMNRLKLHVENSQKVSELVNLLR